MCAYRWGQLKLRPLPVTLFKEFTSHQLCNLEATMETSIYIFDSNMMQYFDVKMVSEQETI